MWSLLLRELQAIVLDSKQPIVLEDVTTALHLHKTMKMSYSLAALSAIEDFDSRLKARVTVTTASPLATTLGSPGAN